MDKSKFAAQVWIECDAIGNIKRDSTPKLLTDIHDNKTDIIAIYGKEPKFAQTMKLITATNPNAEICQLPTIEFMQVKE